MKQRKQLYGLFEKQENGTWKRLVEGQAFPKATAVRIFQGALLAPFLGTPCGMRELKPVGHMLR